MSKPNRSRYIFWNTVSSYARDLTDALLFLILTPFLLDLFGKDGFGLWALVWAYVSFFALLDLGFGPSVMKYVADARGRDDKERQQQVVCTLFWIYMGLAGIATLAIGASALWFDRMFDIAPEHHTTARWVLILVGMRSVVCMPLGVFRGVLVGYQKTSVTNIYKIGATVAYFAAVIMLLRGNPDLRLLALLNLLAGVLPMAGMMIHARKTIPGLSLKPRHFDKSLVRELWGFSFYFMLSQVAFLVATRVDNFVIQGALGLGAVAVYALAMRLSEKAQMFCMQLNRVLTPVVAELHGAGDRANLRAVWLRGTKIAVAFATPLLLGCALLAEPLIVSWTGPEFAEAGLALQLLIGAVFVAVLHGNSSNLLSMCGRQKALAFINIAAQVTNLALSLYFVREYGIAGVAGATLISALPFAVVLTQGAAGRLCKMGRAAFYRETLLPVIPGALAMTAAVVLVLRAHPAPGLFAIALLECGAVGVFWLVFWRTGFRAEERTYFKERLGRVLRRKKKQPAAQEGAPR